jgi:hypothetical protein
MLKKACRYAEVNSIDHTHCFCRALKIDTSHLGTNKQVTRRRKSRQNTRAVHGNKGPPAHEGNLVVRSINGLAHTSRFAAAMRLSRAQKAPRKMRNTVKDSVAWLRCGKQHCPTGADEIATDRPDVTNSSLVVPYGSLQAENGVDWSARHGTNVLDGTNTRLRLGVARCTEFLIDVPNAFALINGAQPPSGFSDVVVSFKRQLPVPFGFDLSATGGLGFPSGSSKISGRGY